MSAAYRLDLGDSHWTLASETLDEARERRESLFPNLHVRIEESTDGAPWRLVDAGCPRCSSADTMRDLGNACATSCGTDRYPTEVE